MRFLLLLLILMLLFGCSTLQPATANEPKPLPDAPLLSDSARKDPQKAYYELAEHYKVLRTYAKEQYRTLLDNKPVEICPVKIGDIKLPMLGLGEIHLVIFSYCRLADNGGVATGHP